MGKSRQGSLEIGKVTNIKTRRWTLNTVRYQQTLRLRLNILNRTYFLLFLPLNSNYLNQNYIRPICQAKLAGLKNWATKWALFGSPLKKAVTLRRRDSSKKINEWNLICCCSQRERETEQCAYNVYPCSRCMFSKRSFYQTLPSARLFLSSKIFRSDCRKIRPFIYAQQH